MANTILLSTYKQFFDKYISLCSWFLLTLLLLFSFNLKSQGGVDPDEENAHKDPLGVDLVPKSPNAASLGKYGDIPVNLNRGIPNISVPLGVVKGRSLDVPLSLSYHAGGIKVNEEASSVGLGWSLMAGGIITRQVNGIPDEELVGYNNYWNVEGHITGFNHEIPATESYYYYEKVLDPKKLADSQPDIFSFNFMGYSGKFMLKEDRVYLLPKQPIRIEFLGSDGIGNTGFKRTVVDYDGTGPNDKGGHFVITTPDGNKFYFEAKEITELDETSPFSGEKYVSAWNLTKIETANGLETITFTYEQESVKTTSYNITANVNFGVNRLEGIPTGQASLNVIHNDLTSYTFITQNRLVAVETDVMKADFIYSENNREDLDSPNAFALENISLYNKHNTELNLIRSYKLSYSYFNDNITHDVLLKKRLKLNMVEEIGAENESMPPYIFEYNEGLPKKDAGTDYWGYNNGKHNSKGIPQFVYDREGLDFVGADKEPDVLKAQVGILTKITYPTGGSSLFNYEQNTYKLFTPEYPWYTEVKRAKAVNNSNSEVFPNIVAIDNFELTEKKLITFRVDMVAPHSFPDVKPRVFLYKVENRQIVGEPLKQIIALGSGLSPVDHHSVFKMELNVGNYRIVAETGIRNSTCEITTEGTGYYDYENPNYSKAGPGLRVASITTHDGIDIANDIIKTYNYNDDENISTGNYAHALDRFISSVKQTYYTYIPDFRHPYLLACGGEGDFYFTLNSQPIRKTPFFVGLRYASVTEEIEGNGRTVNHFYLNNKSQSDGNLLRQEVFKFDQESGKYSIISSKANNYSLGNNQKSLTSLYVEKLLDDQCHDDHIDYDHVDGCKFNKYGGNIYSTKIYYINSEWDYLQSTEEKTWDEEGNIFTVVTSFEHSYNSFQLKKVIEKNSNGQIFSTYYRYPEDYLFRDCLELLASCNNSIENYHQEWLSCHKANYNCLKDCNDDCNSSATCDVNYKSSVNSLNCKANYENCRTEQIASSDAITKVIAAMQDRKMFSSVIETYKTIKYSNDGDEWAISGKLIKYNFFANQIHPHQVFVFNSKEGIKHFQYSKKDLVNIFRYSGNYKLEGTFQKYDLSGNLLEHNKVSDIYSSYFWNENKTLPLAQVVNAEVSQIYYEGFENTGSADEQAFSGQNVLHSGFYNLDLNISPTNLLMSYWYYQNDKWEFSGEVPFNNNISTAGSKLDEIRVFPKGALMTTYNYNLKNELTSVCDPNNVVSYYEYDAFGRLEYIMDSQKNILKKYEYKYGQ